MLAVPVGKARVPLGRLVPPRFPTSTACSAAVQPPHRRTTAAQCTVNNQMVVGTLMNLCDDPNRVSVGNKWIEEDLICRVPIVVTGEQTHGRALVLILCMAPRGHLLGHGCQALRMDLPASLFAGSALAPCSLPSSADMMWRIPAS